MAASSWWAKAILIGAIVAVTMLLVAPLGSRLGLFDLTFALLMLVSAAVPATLGFFLGLIALFVSRKRGFRRDLPMLGISILTCGAVLGFMGLQFLTARSVPPIHNISTDVLDPPEFSEVVVGLRGEGSNPLAYDAPEIAAQQRQAYPAVETLNVESAPEATVDRVVSVLKDMGLDVVNVDREAGIVEATDTSFWFGFKDDVVVRVRPSETGSVVDARSVSRVGVSDLGVNARRIEDILTRLG